jgi:hypothetical protein
MITPISSLGLRGRVHSLQFFQDPDAQDKCRFFERIFEPVGHISGIVLKYPGQPAPVVLVLPLQRPCCPPPSVGHFFPIGRGAHGIRMVIGGISGVGMQGVKVWGWSRKGMIGIGTSDDQFVHFHTTPATT